MNYVVEYEVIGNRVCGVVKHPNSGTPLHYTELCDNQNEASILVHNYIAAQSPEQSQPIHQKSCCGR